MNRLRRYGPLCRAPLGETHMIGSARSPRPHERDAALTLAWRSVVGTGFALPRDAGRRPPPGELASAPLSDWRGVASSVRVSRSRAMPVGGPHRENWPALRFARRPALRGTRRDGNRPDGWGLRRRGPAGRCADRRSAFPCGRRHLDRWGPRVGLHFHSKGGAALTLAGLRVIDAGFALPRDAGRRPALQENWPALRCRAPSCLERYAPRREPSRQLGSSPRRPGGRAGPHRENSRGGGSESSSRFFSGGVTQCPVAVVG